jgi:two-component system sensor histidine kinase KdpD
VEAGLAADNRLQLRVCDRGIGIPTGDLERIFQKFYRVQQPDNVSGTGLGLSISQGIVAAHGGRIWAENRAGGGAIFVISLPLAAGAVQAPNQFEEKPV